MPIHGKVRSYGMSLAPKPSKWPKRTRESSFGPEGSDPRVPLRLSVARGRLGLELYEPTDIGPLHIEHLSQSFLGLKFPLDLSGGVPAFRHRRGNLERLVISTDLERIRKWAEPKLRSHLGAMSRPLDLWWLDSGVGVGITRESSAIAWDLLWAPVMGHARLVVSNPRGWGLELPALAEALQLMDLAVGKYFERQGRVLTLKHAARAIGRAVLPAVGARAPATSDVAFSAWNFSDQKCSVVLDSTYIQAEIGAMAVHALELSRIAEPGDDALVRGQIEQARNHYLYALESAPRQRELVLLTAELDVVQGRVEAALGLLGESMPVLTSGTVGARALMGRVEPGAAKDLLAQAAREERYQPLAAMLQLERANCEENGVERRRILDAAVACAPSLAIVRWARLKERAALGDAGGAYADAQHLEAAATGRQERFAICLRAGEVLLAQGLEQQASVLFQRALRYAPDDIAALVGLANALQGLGDSLRAIPLLERAVQIGEDTGRRNGTALVELAKLIASKLGDLSQAVSRLRMVDHDDQMGVIARGLEGRFRLMLGDVVGASVAFARMRELVEIASPKPEQVEWLLEAARFERDVLRDHSAAERHLAVAIRIAPHHAIARELYREVSAVLAVRRQRRSDVTDEAAELTTGDSSRDGADRSVPRR